jgi:peroxiredoxin
MTDLKRVAPMMTQPKGTRSAMACSNCSIGVYKVVFVFALAALLLMCQPGLAAWSTQSEHLVQRMIPIPHPMTSLLRSPSIQNELGLSGETLAQIEKEVHTVDVPLWRLRDLPSDKRNDQAIELIDQLKSRLSEILSAQKMERLNQIVWQAQGVEALLEPDVSARLRLSVSEINTISSHLSIGYQRIAELQRNAEIRSESIRLIRIKAVQSEARQHVMAVLSSLQKDVFTRLLGRRINLSQVRSIGCKAPDIEVDTWINSAPVKLSELKGKVTVVHFYAYGCGNCVRSLPYYVSWANRFDADQFAIVGIHRPESDGERDVEKVRKKAAQARMEYPIAIDNQSLAWQAWGNHDWPTTYLIDKNGHIRYWWYGELNWQNNGSEKLLRDRIQMLIRESRV